MRPWNNSRENGETSQDFRAAVPSMAIHFLTVFRISGETWEDFNILKTTGSRNEI
jgi:hypothetical protein